MNDACDDGMAQWARMNRFDNSSFSGQAMGERARGEQSLFSLFFMASKSPVEALLGAGVVGACFFLLALLAQLLEIWRNYEARGSWMRNRKVLK